MYALISSVVRGGVKVTQSALNDAKALRVPERELLQVAARATKDGPGNYRVSNGFAVCPGDAIVRIVEREIDTDSRLFIK